MQSYFLPQNHIKKAIIHYIFRFHENNNFIAHTKNRTPFYCLWPIYFLMSHVAMISQFTAQKKN